MFYRRLIQGGGLAAILAGILRGVTSFLPVSNSILLQILYFVVDILLLFGLISIYLFQRKETGWWCLSSFVLALTGSALLIGKDVDSAEAFLYPIAALFFAVGISILGVGSWSTKKLSHWVVASWIISTLLGIGYALLGLYALFIFSGLLFSLGFIGAGFQVWLAMSSHRRPEPIQGDIRTGSDQKPGLD